MDTDRLHTIKKVVYFILGELFHLEGGIQKINGPLLYLACKKYQTGVVHILERMLSKVLLNAPLAGLASLSRMGITVLCFMLLSWVLQPKEGGSGGTQETVSFATLTEY